MKYYDKLIFELSKPGRKAYTLPASADPSASFSIPSELLRAEAPALPEVRLPYVFLVMSCAGFASICLRRSVSALVFCVAMSESFVKFSLRIFRARAASGVCCCELSRF